MEAPSQSETCLAFVKTVNYISVICNLTPLGTGPNPLLIAKGSCDVKRVPPTLYNPHFSITF